MPVLAPLTHDTMGSMLNTNADTIAAEVAKALSEYYTVTLVYCFEKNGVLHDETDNNSVIPRVTPALFKLYVEQKIIQGGMIPKLENAFQAIRSGVKQVIITHASAIGKEGGTVVVN